MSMVVKNNVAAQMVLSELNKSSSILKKSLEKVSTGQKIVNAKNDASNYAISEKMREQIRSLEQDSQNVQNGSALIKIAENGINSIVDELRNLKELAINSANDHNTDNDRATIQKEFEPKMANINDIANSTNYNGIMLLDGRWKPLKGDGATVTLTGTRDIITGYDTKTENYIETIITSSVTTETYTYTSIGNTLVPDTVLVPTTYTSITGYYTQDSPYSYPATISEAYTKITGYSLEPCTVLAPTTYTSLSGYYTDSHTEVTLTPATSLSGYFLETVNVDTTVAETYTSLTGYYTQPLTPVDVTEPTNDGQVVMMSTATFSSGQYKYTIPAFMNNKIIKISTTDFATTGTAGQTPLVITIPEGITDLEFIMENNSKNLSNVYFDVKAKNAHIWFNNLKLMYNNKGLDQSVIEFNNSSNNNVLSLFGPNTIEVTRACSH